MAIRNVLIALTSAAVMAAAAGCGTSSTSNANTSSTATAMTSSAAAAQSACAEIGGTIDPDQTCHLHSAMPTYTLDFRFPVDYPDQQALTTP
jgi:hypothetical protein